MSFRLNKRLQSKESDQALKKGYSKMIQESIFQQPMKILNMYAPNNRVTNMWGKTDLKNCNDQ